VKKAQFAKPRVSHRPPSREVIRHLSSNTSAEEIPDTPLFETAEESWERYKKLLAAAAVTAAKAKSQSAKPASGAPGSTSSAASTASAQAGKGKKVPPAPPPKPSRPQTTILDTRASELHLTNEQMLLLLLSVKDGKLSVEEALDQAKQQEMQAIERLKKQNAPAVKPEKGASQTESQSNHGKPATNDAPSTSTISNIDPSEHKEVSLPF
jgi:hypothetical protein